MKYAIGTLNVLGICALLSAGCVSDPDEYADPPEPAADVSPPEIDAGAEPDTTTETDATLAPETTVPSDAVAPSDAGPGPVDTAPVPEEVTEPPTEEVTEPPTEEVVEATTCPCSFQLAATQPLAQDYVWITGDFLDPPWPAHLDDGAMPLELNDAGDTWEIAVDLPDLSNVEYKYLAGWSDNPGPVWRGPNGDTDSDNGYLYVICGQVPCGSGE